MKLRTTLGVVLAATCGAIATTTSSPALAACAETFTCTEVLGFSQTGMWFLPPPDGGGGFLPIVDPGPGVHWEIRACAGAGIAWADPNDACWTSTPWDQPCTQNADNPDRVLLTISIPTGIPTLTTWVSDIQTEIANIRAKYSNVRQIILQPVVGGPNGTTCPFQGNATDPVHASEIAPTIAQAIAQVVAADTSGMVFVGMQPTVRTCADYADDTGHLCWPNFDSCGTLNARTPIGQTIGDFYAGFCDGGSTTSTTTGATSTTTTTLPGQSSTTDRCLAGTELMLVDPPGRAAGRRLLVQSNDTPQLVLGDGADVATLIAQGGSLTVRALGSDGFEVKYPLSAAGWRLLRARNPRYGVRFRNQKGPINTVLFKAGRVLEVTGTGPQLVQSLGAEPIMVEVDLQIAQYQYHLAFGSGAARRFKVNKRLVSRGATRPEPCPAAPAVAERNPVVP
jgi:hypothetical protein